jgi:hypothetical protein
MHGLLVLSPGDAEHILQLVETESPPLALLSVPGRFATGSWTSLHKWACLSCLARGTVDGRD